jgi:hypothetical protein
MTTLTVTDEQQRAAKVGAIASLLAIAIVVFGNYVLLTPLIVPGKKKLRKPRKTSSPTKTHFA